LYPVSLCPAADLWDTIRSKGGGEISGIFKIFSARIDGFVKSLKSPLSVIPAQAGIQYFQVVRIIWIPVFTGMTTFYDSIRIKKGK
ncbi:MAG: hypothetical protein QME83_16705, partial [Thermodesulfobacteriota bacterium]|nr:hypothetical protein [Thermodesulfobacteriota bacterium]